MTRILFILKRQDNLPTTGSYGLSTGLLNSARLVVDVLNKHGNEAKLVEVIDNNDIDREVTSFKPTEVIIEALWVIPEKFDVLIPLHPDVTWNIRLHSELPFIANEGIAMQWLLEYARFDNVRIACNSPRLLEEMRFLIRQLKLDDKKIWFAPNCYSISEYTRCHKKLKQPGVINVGCFGAIRPMKNQLAQAVAAIKFADFMKLRLRFHINVGRAENNGSQVLKNLRGLFDKLEHELVEHQWVPHDQFLQTIKTLDIGMQVSLSETFNIVAADMVSSGIPIVTSPEITWASNLFAANPNSTVDILCKLKRAWMFSRINVKLNQRRLKKVSTYAAKYWIRWLAAHKA